MATGRLVAYNVLIPVAVFFGLITLGAPVDTAVLVGVMTGCLSVALMMLGSVGARERDDGSKHHSNIL